MIRPRPTRPLLWIVALAVLATACNGDSTPAETDPPGSSQTSVTIATPTTVATPSTTVEPTVAPPEEISQPTQPPAGGIEFVTLSQDTSEYAYTISYPILIEATGQPAAANAVIETWAAATIAELETAAAGLEAKATLIAQIAPELINDDVFSVSGVSTRFQDAGAGTVELRHGWIIRRSDGTVVRAASLFLDGDLTALAEAARDHLVRDVLGSADALAGPDGLLPVPANFDAVWITADGIGVGFDENQVAASEFGSPAVFISFVELDPFLAKSGVLEPLAGAATLPEN